MTTDLFKTLNIKIRSCDIKFDVSKNKKVLTFRNGWDSEYDSKLNGAFIKTGESSNVVILDLDNMENKTCKALKKMADECSNMVVKTRKGYHYWFRMDCTLTETKHVKEHDFDYLANSSIVLAPPSKYSVGIEEYSYKLMTMPENESLNSMSAELISYMKQIFTEKTKPREKELDKIQKKELVQVEKCKIIYDKLNEQQMRKLLQTLHIKRANDYILWIMTGLALIGDGYNFSLWEEFSKRSVKYEEGDCYYVWNLHLKPNRITSATLIYWLKCDNYEEYCSLFSQKKISNYDGNIDLSCETEFSDKKMFELLKNDIQLLGDTDYIDNVNITKSFKYFNFFHIQFTYADYIDKIDIEGKRKYLSSMNNIESAYAHYQINSKTNFCNLWRKSSERQRYDKKNFLPNMKCPTNTYNTFTGFVYDSENKDYDYEKIKPLIEHIRYICNDEVSFNYVVKWFAHIRQRPNRKTCTSLVLYSDTQGTGKNLAVDIFSRIFKGYSASISETDIDKKFNKKFESKLFIWGDEITGTNKHDSDKLKDLITRTVVNIEPKGKDEYEVNDYSNYVFTTNHSIAFKIEAKDRRMMLINCNEKPKSKEYYANIAKLIEDEDIVIELDKYLSTLDLTDFNPLIIPVTDYKTENIIFNLEAHIKMIQHQSHNFAGRSHTPNDLYIKSIEYAKANRKVCSYTVQKVYKDLTKYFGKFKIRREDGIYYEFPENLTQIIDQHIKNVLKE